MRRGMLASATAVLGLAVALSGCVEHQVIVVDGTVVTVAATQPYTSANPGSTQGFTLGNLAVAAITRSGFAYYTDDLEIVRDESFGTYEVLSEQPLTVRYRIAPDVTWSDGVPVDAADLLLAWAAGSGALNTPDVDREDLIDPETGAAAAEHPDEVVFFDNATGSRLDLVSSTPVVEGSALTLVFDEFFADWEMLVDVGVPAHIVASRALGIDDPTAAKQALIDAILQEDVPALAAVARFWNTGFALTGMPADPGLLVSNGPYVVSDLVPDQSVTLTANPAYRGARQPSFESVVLRVVPDAAEAIRALGNGVVDVVSVPSGPGLLDALAGFDGVTVSVDDGPIHEHLDLRFAGSKHGTFDDPRLREAFLLTVPRRQIIDTVIRPLNPRASLRDSLVLPPGAPGYDETRESNGMDERFGEVDIERARTLIAAAGVESPRVCLLYAAGDERRAATFALIRESAGQAGFLVEDCSSPDWGALLGTAGHHDAALFGWQAAGLGVTNTVETFHTDGRNNYSGYSNAEVDALLRELSSTADAGRRREIPIEVDRILTADSYGLPITQLPVITAVREGIGGVSPIPWQPGALWNVWQWSPSSAG